jgi:hypothetical protein
MPDSYPVHDNAEVPRRIADGIPGTVISTGPRQPAPSGQSWIVRTLSWLGDWILEGYAIHGESICPCLLDFPGDSDTRADASHRPALASLPLQRNPWAQPAKASRNIDIHAWLASAQPASQRDRFRRPRFVRVRTKRRAAAWKQSSGSGLDMSGDQTPFDGDIESHETGAAPQGLDPFR